MVQYKLCLLYSSRNYLPLLNKTFTSFKEKKEDHKNISFNMEKRLINYIDKNNLKDKIISIMDTNYRYIQAIKSTEARNGKIVIVSIEENNEIEILFNSEDENAKLYLEALDIVPLDDRKIAYDSEGHIYRIPSHLPVSFLLIHLHHCIPVYMMIYSSYIQNAYILTL